MAAPLDLDIVAAHAEEAAFAWLIRDGAALAPHYDRAGLAQLDERIEAHLDGLRIADQEGMAACAAALELPESVFPLLALATERNDDERTDAALALAEASRPAARAAVAALAWVRSDRAQEAAARLLAPSLSAERRRIGVAALAARRVDPGGALANAVLDSDLALKSRALRAAGELGRRDLAGEVRAEMSSSDAACASWAAWSAALLGEPAANALWNVARTYPAFAERAVAVAVRCCETREARQELEGLAARPETVRAALIGAGVLGDPALIPWLLECVAVRALARLAADAFATVTGATIAGELGGARPEGLALGPNDLPEDEDVSGDPDAPLPWPRPDALAAWWREREGSLRRGVRYLAGLPITREALEHELVHASQRRRASAAIELALREPGRPLAEVRAR